MIDTLDYGNFLSHNFSFFTGVPDSLLKELCVYFESYLPAESTHIAANNEGGAVALASGYYLASGCPALVYMQNSGFGNAINPLLSLNDAMVYGIPLLMFIGWRGEPGVADEPQHLKQGIVTLPMLQASGIPYSILPDSIEQARNMVLKIKKDFESNSAPYALVVRKNTFSPLKRQTENLEPHLPSRENAISVILECLSDKDIVVSTTGMTSREVFEIREKRGENHTSDFLTVGSMGYASQIAAALAFFRPDNRFICLDGDGAFLMQMGGLATIGTLRLENFIHIVLNNGAHDSVGGQPTAGRKIDICGIAQACGYHESLRVESLNDLRAALLKLLSAKNGTVMLEVTVKKGARKDLGRPTISPEQNKRNFMEKLSRQVI